MLIQKQITIWYLFIKKYAKLLKLFELFLTSLYLYITNINIFINYFIRNSEGVKNENKGFINVYFIDSYSHHDAY